jgi:hypothetical protein
MMHFSDFFQQERRPFQGTAMRLILMLLCAAAVTTAPAFGQSPVDDSMSPQEAYAQGFKDGWKEGYAQAKKDLSGATASVVAPKPTPYPITVSLASYGTSNRNCNATHYVARRANGKLSASIDATNSICGDPAPGDRKSLDVTYVCGDRAKTATAYEHRTVYLNCSD